MGVKLKDKLSQTKTIQVDWDGDTVDVSYHPNVVTPALLEDVDKAAKEDNLDVLGVMLEPVLDWWDIILEDETRMPTTKEAIRTVPLRFIGLVQKAIEVDQNPPE